MSQKTVVLGVTGCIGAYKACTIVRELQKAGMRVKVMMTKHATELVRPLTFEALSHEAVFSDMFSAENSDPIPHISLAKEADACVIAPCTANTLAKLANGIADNILTSTVLAMHCPIVVAPAANVHMYEDESVQRNLDTLRNRGWHIIEGGAGYLACGDEGYGRLAEPQEIVSYILDLLSVVPDLQGKHVLVTAGPTRESIDPVRFISNYSSGKTGFALAEAARDRGATVSLITGPVSIEEPTGINVIHVTSALDMYEACKSVFPSCDIAIFSAAVSDFRPAHCASKKLKKGSNTEALSTMELVENPDILASLAAEKIHQVVVGYAAETDNVLENAANKLKKKRADFLVANEVSPDKGFGSDDNSIWLVDAKQTLAVGHASKTVLANVVLDKALAILLEKEG